MSPHRCLGDESSVGPRRAAGGESHLGLVSLYYDLFVLLSFGATSRLAVKIVDPNDEVSRERDKAYGTERKALA